MEKYSNFLKGICENCKLCNNCKNSIIKCNGFYTVKAMLELKEKYNNEKER